MVRLEHLKPIQIANFLYSLFVKQMAVNELSRELKELSCRHEKAVVGD